MNREKLQAALSAVVIEAGHMISKGDAPTCYCGLGAMLHAAGVPDDTLDEFDVTNEAGSMRRFRQNVDQRFGATLAEFYGFDRERDGDAVIEAVLWAVDDMHATGHVEIMALLGRRGVLAPVTS